MDTKIKKFDCCPVMGLVLDCLACLFLLIKF